MQLQRNKIEGKKFNKSTTSRKLPAIADVYKLFNP